MNAPSSSPRGRRRRVRRGLLTAVAVLAAPGITAVDAAERKDIFGWVEWVEVGAHEIELKAKLDTGAETASAPSGSPLARGT